MQAEMSEMPSGSWRQAIFNRVVTPGKIDESDGKKSEKKTKEELRELWRTAINQQILLIRMEKENARLRGNFGPLIIPFISFLKFKKKKKYL